MKEVDSCGYERAIAKLETLALGPTGTYFILHQRRTATTLGVDACAADLMRPAIYDAYHHIVGKKDALQHTYNVVGRTLRE